jgi:hypothetical protein
MSNSKPFYRLRRECDSGFDYPEKFETLEQAMNTSWTPAHPNWGSWEEGGYYLIYSQHLKNFPKNSEMDKIRSVKYFITRHEGYRTLKDPILLPTSTNKQ